MFTSGAAISLVLSALVLSTQAVPTTRQASVTCSGTGLDAPWLNLPGTYPGYNSTYSLSNALAAVGSNASAGANPLVIMNTLGPFVGSPGPGFKFLQCASTYMNYPASVNGDDGTVQTYYGHIEPATAASGDAVQCITLTTVDSHDFLTLSPCSLDDSAAQEAQYFELNKVVNEPDLQEVIWNVTLIGHPSGASGDSFSFTAGTKDAPAINVARNAPSTQQLTMDYVHVN